MEQTGTLPSEAAAKSLLEENGKLKDRLKKLTSLFRTSQELIEIQDQKLSESSQHVAALAEQLRAVYSRRYASAESKHCYPEGLALVVGATEEQRLTCSGPSLHETIETNGKLRETIEKQQGEIGSLQAALQNAKSKNKEILVSSKRELQASKQQRMVEAESYQKTKAALEARIKELQRQVARSRSCESTRQVPSLGKRKTRPSSMVAQPQSTSSSKTELKPKFSFKSKTVVLTGEFRTASSKEDIKKRIINCGGRVVGSISGRTDVLVCGEILQDGRAVWLGNKYKEAQARGVLIMNEEELRKHLNEDYSERNKSDEAKHKHVAVVRQKDQRCDLPGHTCERCKDFYSAIDKSFLSEAQRRELVQDLSRHRYHNSPPPTPPHFWSLPSLSTP